MARVRFQRADGSWVSFGTKARRGPKRSARATAPKRPKARRGSWPKGKVPPHLKKYLFR